MWLRRLGGAAVALVLGLTVSVHAADDDTPPPPAKNKFLGGRFGRPKDDKATPTPPKDAAGIVRSPASDALEADRVKEFQDYMRRLEVCDRLKEIAERTNNKDLDRQAQMLTERAFQVYMQRSGAPPAESAEAILGQRNSGRSATDILVPERPQTNGRTVNLREGTR